MDDGDITAKGNGYMSRWDVGRGLVGVLLLISLLIVGTAYAEGDQGEEASEPVGVKPLAFFVLLVVATTLIGIFAVMTGVGGGVVFTPLFMGFTDVDSYIIRSTGLFVAMAGALVASRPYLRRGIVNTRLLLAGAVPYTAFAVLGALVAGYIEAFMGTVGEALIRGVLGVIVLSSACLFIFYGDRARYPKIERVDEFTKRLHLAMPYWEASLGRVVRYALTRARVALCLFCLVGFISGLFGLGAGWAMVPVFNMVMMAPLKVAATTSSVMISLGNTAAVWPYIAGGGMFPLFAVPSMIGLITGALIGSRIMLKVKAGFIRWLIVVVLLVAGVRLVVKAFGMLV